MIAYLRLTREDGIVETWRRDFDQLYVDASLPDLGKRGRAEILRVPRHGDSPARIYFAELAGWAFDDAGAQVLFERHFRGPREARPGTLHLDLRNMTREQPSKTDLHACGWEPVPDGERLPDGTTVEPARIQRVRLAEISRTTAIDRLFFDSPFDQTPLWDHGPASDTDTLRHALDAIDGVRVVGVTTNPSSDTVDDMPPHSTRVTVAAPDDDDVRQAVGDVLGRFASAVGRFVGSVVVRDRGGSFVRFERVASCSSCGSTEVEEQGESGEFWTHCHACGHDEPSGYREEPDPIEFSPATVPGQD